jgi:histidinol-phosphate aminotransferase
MDFKKLIRNEVLDLKAYAVESEGFKIKLDANENPYSLPDELLAIFQARISGIHLNRYPELGSPHLVSRLATRFEVDRTYIIVGNGSDEIIQMLCTAMGRQGSCMLVPTPTFVMYRIIGLMNGWRVIEVPLDDCFDLDRAGMLDMICREAPNLIFLSSPNNPTGNSFSSSRIEEIITSAPGVVVVDEAYGAFSGTSFLPLMKKYDNLVILRTLSKVGMAAMRVGFMIAPPSLIEELNKVRLPYNINTFSQAAALFYLDHEAAFAAQVDDITRERERLVAALKRIKGINPMPSNANFIFFSCDFDADHVYRCLIKQGILIKNFNSPGLMKNCMRVTVGTPEENEAFIRTIQSLMSEM